MGLAAFDHRTNQIEPTQLATFRETAKEAIELALDAIEDKNSVPPGGAAANVFVIPGRGDVDRTAAELIANMIAHETSCQVNALTKSSGLTAIASLQTEIHNARVDAIVLLTVGGLEEAHLLTQELIVSFAKYRCRVCKTTHRGIRK